MRLLACVAVLAVALLVLTSTFLGAPPRAAAAPNILVIVTDDQRAADTMLVMPKTRHYFGAEVSGTPTASR